MTFNNLQNSKSIFMLFGILLIGITVNVSSIDDVLAASGTLTSVGSLVDGASTFFGTPLKVDTITIDDKQYSIVTGNNENGIQIIDITDTANPIPVSSATDGGVFTELEGAFDIETTTIDGTPYVIVTGNKDDGVQIIDISTPSSPTSVASIANGIGGFNTLDNPVGLDVFTTNNDTYLIVSSLVSNGISIIDISDPSNPIPASSATDGIVFTELAGATDVETTTIDGTLYAIVAAKSDDGVQIIDISDTANPQPVSSMTDGQTLSGTTFETLDGANSIAVVSTNTNTYALVTAQYDSGIQVIDITNPANPSAEFSITDGMTVNGRTFDILNSPQDIDVVTIGSNTFAFVASFGNHGIQVIDITNPANPLPVTSITDDASSHYRQTYDVNYITIESVGYLVSVSVTENALQITQFDSNPLLDISTPHLDLDAGTITFDFDETMDASEIALGQISIEDNTSSSPVALTGAILPGSDSDKITITLDSTHVDKIKEFTGILQLDVQSDAFQNLQGIFFAGLDDAEMIITDTQSAPKIKYVSVSGNDVYMIFDRDVKLPGLSVFDDFEIENGTKATITSVALGNSNKNMLILELSKTLQQGHTADIDFHDIVSSFDVSSGVVTNQHVHYEQSLVIDSNNVGNLGELFLASTTELSEMEIHESVLLNFKEILTGNTVTMTNGLNVTNTAFDLSIPKDTLITGIDGDIQIYMENLGECSSYDLPNTESRLCVSIGKTSVDLSLNKPTKIVLYGQATADFAYYIDSIGTHKITNQCSSNDAFGLDGNDECSIVDGDDLVIWTTHFTGFGAGTSFGGNDDESGNGGDNKWKTKPTFGISHTTHLPIVECGFSWDDTCYDITDNWHTPFDKVDVKTGQVHSMNVTVFTQRPLLFMEFGLVPEVGQLHNAETKIEVMFDRMDKPSITSLSIIQNDKIIDDTILNATISTVSCGFVESECYQLQLTNILFREAPLFEKIAIIATDASHRSQTTYLNEGFDISGPSFNPDVTESVFIKKSNQDDGKHTTFTQTDKANNLWIDENGVEYQRNSVGSWFRLSPVEMPSCELKMKNILERHNCVFSMMQDYEIKRATEKFDASKLVSDSSKSNAIDISEYNQRTIIQYDLGMITFEELVARNK